MGLFQQAVAVTLLLQIKSAWLHGAPSLLNCVAQTLPQPLKHNDLAVLSCCSPAAAACAATLLPINATLSCCCSVAELLY